MPKLPPTATPKYRKHKATGQAVVTIAGRDHYLGPHGTKASHAEYDRLVGEWIAAGRPSAATPAETDLTIIELCNGYRKFAEAYYRKDGEPTGEWYCVKSVVKWLRTTYGHTRAIDFGPLALRALRARMIDGDRSRATVNKHVDRVRRIFKWAAAEELLPIRIYQTLAAVPGLRRGKSDARETQPVAPVDDAVVDATLLRLPAIVAGMVRLQRLTGMRPGEVCILRPCDVDTSGKVWSYRPQSHKTEHHGHERVIFIGPKAQDVLRPYLLRAKDAYCFSPADSERRRRQAAHESRKTPLSCGNRPGTNCKNKRKRTPGERYTPNSYRRAIERACDLAFPAPEIMTEEQVKEWRKANRWAPNQLRHSAGTEIRRRFGLEAAQVYLGHTQANVTEIYAEADRELARKVAREVG